MPQTIFITGASGYIGTQVTMHAISSSFSVRALSRSHSSDTHLTSLGATPVRGDLSSHGLLTTEASRADMVIHLADSLCGNFGNITMEERFRINNEAVEALAAGLLGSGKPLVIASGSLYAGADPEGRETDEASPPWPQEPFGAGSEKTALSFRDKGVKVNIVRLAPWVYGREGSGVKLFMTGAAQAGEMVYVGDGAQRTTAVHVDDAARLFLLIALKGGNGEIYNATAETDVTFKQLAEAMAGLLDLPVRSQSFEETEENLGFWFASFLSLENRAGNGKARALGWEVEAEKGILEEIRTGSYVRLAEQLRK